MRYFVISDTHFGHTKMQEKCGRPDGFEDAILKNLATLTTPTDIMIHLGDIAWGKHEYWMGKFMEFCRGTKWLVKGNHDSHTNSWYHDHGWHFVGDAIQLDVFGERLLFTHRPIAAPKGMVNVHGHLHKSQDDYKYSNDGRHVLIQIEDTLSPILLKEALSRPRRN